MDPELSHELCVVVMSHRNGSTLARVMHFKFLAAYTLQKLQLGGDLRQKSYLQRTCRDSPWLVLNKISDRVLLLTAMSQENV